MANIKISDLPAATSVAAGDLFEVSQGSGTLTSRKATGTQVQSFVLGSYAGATSITTLGTIGTGTWQGTAVAVTYGGTGASTAAGARTNLGLAIGTDVQAWDADLDAIAALAGTSGLLKKTAANTWSLDTATYLTSNQTLTLSGDATGSGTTAITVTLSNSGVTAGTYTLATVTVDAKGRITSASSGGTPVTSFSAGTTGLTPSTGSTGAVTLAGTLAVANGGTGGTTAATARSSLGAAASGANSDITSLSGLTTALSLAQGGTGSTTAAGARTNLGLGTAATMTGPSGTIVGTTDTQSLSNKTLTAPVVTDYSESVVTANTTTAYTISLTSGTVQNLTLTGNCTFTFPTATAGKSFLLVLKQDATGSRTVTWPAAVKWPGSTAPTITSTASKADLYAFTADGTNWYGRSLGQNYL